MAQLPGKDTESSLGNKAWFLLSPSWSFHTQIHTRADLTARGILDSDPGRINKLCLCVCLMQY